MDKWGINSDRMERTAREYLMKDIRLNADILQNMDLGRSKILQADEQGVLIQDRFSGTYMIAADSEEKQRELLEDVEEMEVLTTHYHYTLDLIKEKYTNINEWMLTREAVYLKDEPIKLPEELTEGIEIRQMDASYFDLVKAEYTTIPNDEYLMQRLESGIMHGAFIDGEIAGFVGMQEEGGVGMLQVIEKFRRRGVAMVLDAFMTNYVLEMGMIPFCHIEDDNDASYYLHLKLGYEISEPLVYWFFSEKWS